MALRNISPISSDSELSIVVWLAQPTRWRCTSGSKPGETARSNVLQELLARSPPAADVVAGQRRLGAVEHDQVVTAPVSLGL